MPGRTIAVVDYGMGNLRSVSKALEHAAGAPARVRVTSEPAVVADADSEVVPGQGAAADCMRSLAGVGMPGDVGIHKEIQVGVPRVRQPFEPQGAGSKVVPAVHTGGDEVCVEEEHAAGLRREGVFLRHMPFCD